MCLASTSSNRVQADDSLIIGWPGRHIPGQNTQLTIKAINNASTGEQIYCGGEVHGPWLKSADVESNTEPPLVLCNYDDMKILYCQFAWITPVLQPGKTGNFTATLSTTAVTGVYTDTASLQCQQGDWLSFDEKAAFLTTYLPFVSKSNLAKSKSKQYIPAYTNRTFRPQGSSQGGMRRAFTYNRR